MKVALIHDYLNQFGGAERVIETLHEIFPNAPVYTSIYKPGNFPNSFKKMDIRTSFMQDLPFVFDNFRAFAALYPFAFQSFNLKEYDLIISSSSAFAKGVKKRKDAIHVCYCYNPMRFVWRYNEYIKKENFPAVIKSLLPYSLVPLKFWDLETSKGVDYFIANSNAVATRIKTLYNRDSEVIYPPIDTKRFDFKDKNGDYFLIVSRLAAYKRIDIAVKALSLLNIPLKIVGEGPAGKSLKELAFSNVEFLGKLSDDEVKPLYSECKALILPGEEDFGMTPLEAAASGRPTIAYAKGGALETVIEGKTGIFFKEPSAESLMEAVLKFDTMMFDKKMLRFHAENFDKEIFKQKIRSMLHENKIF